jgi:hypothetical protein
VSMTVPSVNAARDRPTGAPRLPGSAAALPLPYPETLPRRRSDLEAALAAAVPGGGVLAAFRDRAARDALRRALLRPAGPPAAALPADQIPAPARVGAPSRQAQDEQREHDRYFKVGRVGDRPGRDFVAGLVLTQLAAYQNCLDMGVTLLDGPDWDRLFEGLRALLRIAGDDVARPHAEEPSAGGAQLPERPTPAGWRDGYDPAARWLLGHQLFFALIQGAIVGLNCFADAGPAATGAGARAEAAAGLALSAAFLRSSAAAMKLASDFAPADYDATIRPDMAPPRVRAGFSGLQTRDHAYLVRLFGALKPVLADSAGLAAHEEFVEAVVGAYAAHEFICARFRGDVLPSLRMAAATRGQTARPGTAVIREMMRARLALIDPGRATTARPEAAPPAGSRP